MVGKVVAGAGSYLWPATNKPWYPFLSALAATGQPLDELLSNIVDVATGASVNYAQAAAHVVDFYLDDARAKERQHIVQLVNSKDTQSAELLRGYVCEAMRMYQTHFGPRRLSDEYI
jgi:linoleate 10R-lipoxygenase